MVSLLRLCGFAGGRGYGAIGKAWPENADLAKSTPSRSGAIVAECFILATSIRCHKKELLHPAAIAYPENRHPRNRRLLASTVTELKAMAAAATHGLRRMWKLG